MGPRGCRSLISFFMKMAFGGSLEIVSVTNDNNFLTRFQISNINMPFTVAFHDLLFALVIFPCNIAPYFRLKYEVS
jgi:hypothetical protein